MDRNQLQRDIVDAFCDLTPQRGLAVLATGTGKARISLMIIKKLNPKKVLFLTDSTINRDVTIKEEFIKWKMKTFLKRTEFATYQLAYKWRKEDKDLSKYLIIADECDFAFTDKYGAFFKEYADVPTLAMTGFITDEKFRLFKHLFPRFVNIPAQEMQDNNVLNKVKFVFIKYALSKRISRKVEYSKFGKKLSFLSSENAVYMHFIEQEEKATTALMAAIAEGDPVKIAKQTRVLEEFIPSNRAEFLYSLESSVDMAKSLIVQIGEENDTNKVITFSERTVQADKLSQWVYHGKVHKDTAEENFTKFNEGKIRSLATCSKVNRGVNVEKLNYGILESYNSSITELVQRVGRLMRLNVDEEGTLYILVPYYIKNGEAYPTRAVNWIRKMYHLLTKDNYKTINYCGTNKIHK